MSMVDETFISPNVSGMQPGLFSARIGSNVRTWREETGVSAADLASCLAMPVESLALIENGSDSFTAEQIVQICEMFDVRPSRFLGNVV